MNAGKKNAWNKIEASVDSACISEFAPDTLFHCSIRRVKKITATNEQWGREEERQTDRQKYRWKKIDVTKTVLKSHWVQQPSRSEIFAIAICAEIPVNYELLSINASFTATDSACDLLGCLQKFSIARVRANTCIYIDARRMCIYISERANSHFRFAHDLHSNYACIVESARSDDRQPARSNYRKIHAKFVAAASKITASRNNVYAPLGQWKLTWVMWLFFSRRLHCALRIYGTRRPPLV